jgi:uncharacterized protein YecE (DUF72 family)
LLAEWGTYFRFHGSQGKYQGEYNEVALKEAAEVIRSFWDLNKVAFVAFNNTNEHCGLSALESIRRLKKMLFFS